jgi:hypothetical protein
MPHHSPRDVVRSPELPVIDFRRLGFPGFKKRGRCRDSFRFSTGVMRCAGTTVTLPRLGTVRTYESARKLARRLEAGTARILRKLRRANRAQSRKVRGPANRRKHAARLARIHARVASVRADALHKATASLAAWYETIVCEDLNVAAMTRNRKLARAISDQGLSSKMCSGCGAVKAKVPLSERTYRCGSCGLALDRDVNAAINPRDLAASGAERLNACGGCVRSGLAGRRPLNREPGTAHAGKTGAAAR